jgi:transposase
MDERFAVGNDAVGRRQLVRRLRQLKIALVAIEPTGTFHRALHRHLHAAGLATALVDPLRARRFAQAIGQLAKNDRIDAAMLALMAERLSPAPTAPPDPAQEHLAELATARTAAIAEQVALDNRRAATTDPWLRRTLGCRSRGIVRHIARLDRQIETAIAQAPAIARRAAVLRSIPGVGPVTALALLAYLRELGQLTAKQVAAMAGLAPIARDSGTSSGQRRIRGGRAALRQALYMSALVASRYNPNLAETYRRLRNAGKPPKVALVAIARKLAILANRLVAENRTWTPIPA